jgi:hypothetical protein
MSEIKQVADWIDAAQQKQSTRNVALYFGLCMEELIEGLGAIGGRGTFFGATVKQMKILCLEIKQGSFDDDFEGADKVELLDSACDMQWCSIGLAHMIGDARGAFNEVVRSNYSKFEGGVCALDENGKVIKGPSYTAPDIAKFVRIRQD